MMVSSNSEFTYHHDGEHLYFCSQHCMNQFEEQAGQYLDRKTSPSAKTQNETLTYTCPMHPEIRQQRPGTCPKCGMALEPVTFSAEEKNEELINDSCGSNERQFRFSDRQFPQTETGAIIKRGFLNGL
jgi:Cu+-exporting ATPase